MSEAGFVLIFVCVLTLILNLITVGINDRKKESITEILIEIQEENWKRENERREGSEER